MYKKTTEQKETKNYNPKLAIYKWKQQNGNKAKANERKYTKLQQE